MKKFAPHLLIGVNVLLGAGLAWMWFTPQGQLRNVEWTAPQAHTTDYGSSLPALPVVANADTGRFIAMLDRPLFAITRRPPPPPPPPIPEKEKEPVDNLSTAQLAGIFHGANEGGIIVQIAGKHRRVRLREQVEGWTLTSVQDRGVVFSKDGQTRTLQLARANLKNYVGQPLAPSGFPSSAASPAGGPPGERAGGSPTPPAPAQGAGAVIRPSFGGGSR